jgi:potassium/hydrogen antiporter
VDAQDVLRDVGLILLVGVAAIPIAALLRVPQMVVLLLAGIALGPSGADIVANPVEGLGAQLVFTLGVSLILFHGGVGISVIVEGAEIVAAMVALAVLTTLLVQATTAGALARRLGLVETAEYVGAGK